MTPRSYLLADHASLPDPERLGLRALAASLGCVEARGVALPGIDAPGDRAALPRVLRAALDALSVHEEDARNAHTAQGHGHRDVAHLHRCERETLQALAFELRAAARVARVGIAAREGEE